MERRREYLQEQIAEHKTELAQMDANEVTQADTLAELTSVPISAYTDHGHARKEKYHRIARRQLRKLATELGLVKGNYDIDSNKAGIAVSGEISLHTDKYYIQVSQSCFSSGREIMYRGCDGRKDYGGRLNGRYANRWAAVAELDDPKTFALKVLAIPD